MVEERTTLRCALEPQLAGSSRARQNREPKVTFGANVPGPMVASSNRRLGVKQYRLGVKQYFHFKEVKIILDPLRLKLYQTSKWGCQINL